LLTRLEDESEALGKQSALVQSVSCNTCEK